MEEATQGQQNPIGGSCQPKSNENEDPCNPTAIITQLTAKSVELEQSRTRSEKQKKTVDTDKGVIESEASKIKKADEDYVKEILDKKREKNELECYWESLNRVIDQAISRYRGDLDTLINEEKRKLTDCQSEVKAHEQAKKAAEQERDSAKEDLKEKKETYDRAIRELDNITDKLTSLTALKSQITQANSQNHLCTVYFLLGELRADLQKLKIANSSEFHASLYKTFCEWTTAMQRVRDADWQLDQRSADLDAKRTACEDNESNFRSKMIERLNKMNCSPCPDKTQTQSC